MSSYRMLCMLTICCVGCLGEDPNCYQYEGKVLSSGCGGYLVKVYNKDVKSKAFLGSGDEPNVIAAKFPSGYVVTKKTIYFNFRDLTPIEVGSCIAALPEAERRVLITAISKERCSLTP